MSGKVINKMMGFLGLDEDLDEFEELEEMEDSDEKEEYDEIISTTKKQNKVVNIHTTVSAKVVIIKPKDFDEATDICDYLKNRKIVVVNTNDLEQRTAQRLIDFLGGASYSLGGEFQDVEKGIYILSPSNVEVSSELKNEISSKGLFSWSK